MLARRGTWDPRQPDGALSGRLNQVVRSPQLAALPSDLVLLPREVLPTEADTGQLESQTPSPWGAFCVVGAALKLAPNYISCLCNGLS